MSIKIKHKRGDTYKIAIVVTDNDETTPYDLTGWTVRSQIRRGGKLVTELDFEEIDITNGEFALMKINTDDWPLGKLESDIEYIDPRGMAHSTETYNIEVIKDITYD